LKIATIYLILSVSFVFEVLKEMRLITIQQNRKTHTKTILKKKEKTRLEGRGGDKKKKEGKQKNM
jgi:hypothetical protein